MISVFILAGVRLYREGLEQSLISSPAVSVIGSAATLADALTPIASAHPDVVLVDLGLSLSLSAAREIRAMRSTTKMIALAVPGHGEDVVACAEAGIVGYVAHDGSLADLVSAIERATRGETLCPPRVTAELFERLAAVAASSPRFALDASLTAREAQIARLIEQGLSNKEIARALSIALPTVKNHVHSVLRKLQVQRRTDIVSDLGRFVVLAGSRSAG